MKETNFNSVRNADSEHRIMAVLQCFVMFAKEVCLMSDKATTPAKMQRQIAILTAAFTASQMKKKNCVQEKHVCKDTCFKYMILQTENQIKYSYGVIFVKKESQILARDITHAQKLMNATMIVA